VAQWLILNNILTVALLIPNAYIGQTPIDIVSVGSFPVEQQVQLAFGTTTPIMVAIARCESGFRHFDKDGNLVRSETKDSGLFQINDIWEEDAKELGLDYKGNVHDNILMAKYILNKQGLNAWTTYKNNCYKQYLKV
jgi:hypothetical protein